MTDRGWWVIHGDELMEAFQKCFEGEDPEFVYIELYANGDVREEGDEDAEEI